MRWALCGLAFALAVCLAIATAAIRAGNTVDRQLLERDYRAIELRVVELRRLSALAVEATSPEQLAETLRELLRAAEAQQQALQEELAWQ